MFDREPVVLPTAETKSKTLLGRTTFLADTLLKRERGEGRGVDDSPN